MPKGLDLHSCFIWLKQGPKRYSLNSNIIAKEITFKLSLLFDLFAFHKPSFQSRQPLYSFLEFCSFPFEDSPVSVRTPSKTEIKTSKTFLFTFNCLFSATYPFPRSFNTYCNSYAPGNTLLARHTGKHFFTKCLLVLERVVCQSMSGNLFVWVMFSTDCSLNHTMKRHITT